MSDDAIFKTRMQQCAQLTAEFLSAALDSSVRPGEIVRPGVLMDAMRYGVLNGGKRLRPFLLIEAGRIFGADEDVLLPVAGALEAVHCYSLIHDDLPAMDDDDLRRGKPTVHKVYDDATAILAGDGLLTLAFDLISNEAVGIEPHSKLQLVNMLARAAGLGGMVGGQMLDLVYEKAISADLNTITTIHKMKTGALLKFACEAGAVAANASSCERQTMAEFGAIIGQAFQLADDILDVTSDAKTMGKATQKDAAAGKKTFIDLIGLDEAKAQLATKVNEAEQMLAPFGARGAMLRRGAQFVAERAS